MTATTSTRRNQPTASQRQRIHNRAYPIATAAICAALLADSAQAQLQVDALSSQPMAYLHSRGIISNPVAEVLFLASAASTPGVVMTSPSPAPAPAGNDATTRIQLGDIFGPDVLWVELDAISSGHDVIPVDTQGVYLPASGTPGWSILSFSVTNESTASSLAGDLATRINSSVLVGNDVYSYAAAGSVGVENFYIDNIVYSRTVSTPVGELAALDYQMALRIANGGALSPPITNNNDVEIFFSLSPSSVANFSPATNGKFASMTSVDAASIYHVQLANGSWGNVSVYRTPAQLQIPTGPNMPPANLDALAVDTRASGPGAILYSLNLPAYQLMVNLGPNDSRMLRDRQNRPLTRRMGLGPGTNIDSLCNHDPELDQHSDVFATPSPTNPGPAGRPMTLGVAIDFEPNPAAGSPPAGDRLRCVLSGWNGQQAEGTVTVYVTADPVLDARGRVIDGGLTQIAYTTARAVTDHRLEFTVNKPAFGKWMLIAEHRPLGTPAGEPSAWSHAAVMQF